MNKTHKTIRAVGYTRVSTATQATEEKVSLEEQRKDIEAYCVLKGYEIVGWYSDVGSGASKRRMEFQRMLKECLLDKFDVIIAWKSDRLSRGMYPATALMEAIEGTEIELEAVKDTIDRDTFELFAWIGKRELSALSERVRMGMRGKYAGGTVAGVAKFGYRFEGESGHLVPVINESEAAIVRDIFAIYVQGIGTYKIAESLRINGVPRRKGGVWNANKVFLIVSDQIYTGRGFYGRTRYVMREDPDKGKEVRKTIRNSPETWVDIAFPAIISNATFQKATELRKANKRVRIVEGERHAVFLLKGLAVCGDCGRHFTTHLANTYNKKTLKDGTTKIYRGSLKRAYVCSRASQEGGNCRRKSIGGKKFEADVWGKVCEVLMDPERIRVLRAQRRQDLSDSSELDSARERLRLTIGKESMLLDAMLEGRFDRDVVDLKLAQIKELREHYEAEVARLESEFNQVEDDLRILDSFIESARTLSERLQSMSDEEKAESLRLLLDQVIVNGPDIKVVFALDLVGTLTTPQASLQA